MIPSLLRPSTLQQHVLVGDSPSTRSLQLEIEAAARSNAKVLVTGETGVGKEVAARLIHEHSLRRAQPFVTINCAGIPDSLLESELFGHARGSFTDAYRDNAGLLRQAHRGTVFLDEVGEMSLRMQALLLRFLETGEVETVGGTAARGPVDVRVVTATNRKLPEAVAAGEFRQDLFYRLNVLHLEIIPLRQRASDVALLLTHFLALYAAQYGTPTPTLSTDTLDLLMRYTWPGNVRELRNVVERLVLRANAAVIEPRHLGADILEAGIPDEPADPTSHQAHVRARLNRLLEVRESFWTAVHPAFISRDITRDDLRFIVRTGLEHTRGSYRLLVDLFNMAPNDYKRFLGFLKQHDCHLPFRRFRTGITEPASESSERL